MPPVDPAPCGELWAHHFVTLSNLLRASSPCRTQKLYCTFLSIIPWCGTSRYTRQVWTETADAHEAATAVSACSPSRRKARADLPAPPVDSERAFPRRRPPAARPSPAPCYASWALPGTARALARPIAVRSRAEGLDTDAARLPTPLVDSEGPPSRSAARAEAPNNLFTHPCRMCDRAGVSCALGPLFDCVCSYLPNNSHS